MSPERLPKRGDVGMPDGAHMALSCRPRPHRGGRLRAATKGWLARVVLLALASTALVEPTVTYAQVPGAEEDARLTFKAARALYDEGHFAEALPRFQEVAAALDSPNAQLYVGRCLRELGRLPEAYEALSLALVGATRQAAEEPRYAETRDAVALERTTLEARVGRLVIAVTDPPPGLALSVGGRSLATSRVGDLVAVDPGAVEIVASAPGFQQHVRRVEVGAGAVQTVTLTLEPAPAGAPSDEAPATPSTGGGVRVAGFIVAGVGVAGIATFAIAGLSANSQFDSLEERCRAEPCTEDAIADDVDTGETLDTVANVGLIVGGVGLAAGALMIALGGPTEEPALSVLPAIVPGADSVGLGMVVRSSF